MMQVAMCRVSVGGRRRWGRREDDAGTSAVCAVGAGKEENKKKENEREGDAGGSVQGGSAAKEEKKKKEKEKGGDAGGCV
ncbi:hypothetical protein AAC387_Pa01g2000 [Persea americana]